jgi:RimJ/RimL family protein N-acetyltransferase
VKAAAQTESRWPQEVTLRDGSEVLIRPIRPEDKEALLRGFERLSPESRYRRFLTPMTTLSPAFLRYLTEVDHHAHEALVAESREGEPVGVARYVRLEGEPESAEIAVAVVDDWQGKGAATALLQLLEERAIAEGIERFVATCLATNRDVLDLFEEIGPKHVIGTESGTVEVEIALPVNVAPQGPLREALRRAAAGVLAFRHPFERPDEARR